jgi:hypothetical protein
MSGDVVESSGGSLNALQKRVLGILSGFEPPFILGGGGALAIYLNHRLTRDLDLFWEDGGELSERAHRIRRRLEDAGVAVSVLQESPGFVRFAVADQETTIKLDLVADPTARLMSPNRILLDGVPVTAESLPDLLTNKLCAMLGRSELRDLVDAKALVEHGVSLRDAIMAAPQKDGGFSPLTFAWILRNFEVKTIGSAAGIADEELQALDRFRLDLIDVLLSTT